MFRVLVLAAVAALVLAAPAEAKRAIRLFTPIEKVVRADAVVVGKVTAIEKDTVTALPVPGATDKVTYQVAVIKIDSGLLGAANLTHVKVGFLPPPRNEPPAGAPGRPIRPGRGFGPVVLTEGQEGLFYLNKHHTGEFYTISPMLAPVEAKADEYKDQVALAKKAAAVLADSAKALKADKPADRFFAATVVLTKYRSVPENAGEIVQEKVSIEESKLVLKALAEGDWKPDPNDPNAANGYQAFFLLGLTDKDGWKYPAVKPGEDAVAKTKEAFAAWLAGPGGEYRINKFVQKK